MRTVTRFCFLLLLAILQTGCGSSQQAPSPDIAPKHAKETAKSRERRETRTEETTKSDKFEAPPIPDAKSPKPFIDEAHTGTAQRKKPDADLPSGILTAGSFDDNINPLFFRSFVGKAGQNSYLNGVTTRLHGKRLEILVKNGQGAPVGNARVSVASGSGEKVELTTRSDGRAIFLSSFDGFKRDADLTVTASSGIGNSTSQKIDESVENCTLTRHIDTLRKRGTSIYPVFASCNDPATGEATEVIMRGAALVTGAQYLFLSNDSGVGDAHGEPHIPYYHIEKLNSLMVRMIAGELSGKRLEVDANSILRTVGVPPK